MMIIDAIQESSKESMSCHHKIKSRGKNNNLVHGPIREKEDLDIVTHGSSPRLAFPKKIDSRHKVIVNKHKPTYLHYACNQGITDRFVGKIAHQIADHIIARF